MKQLDSNLPFLSITRTLGGHQSTEMSGDGTEVHIDLVLPGDSPQYVRVAISVEALGATLTGGGRVNARIVRLVTKEQNIRAK